MPSLPSGPSSNGSSGARSARCAGTARRVLQESRVVPASRRHLLDDDDPQRVRPAALHDRVIHPVDALDASADFVESTLARPPRATSTTAASISGGDTRWKDPRPAPDAPGGRAPAPAAARSRRYGRHARHDAGARQSTRSRSVALIADLPAVALLPGQRHIRSPTLRIEAGLEHAPDSSSNSMPRCRAALGTSEWLVMPGAVFTSSSQGRPARSRMKSTRPSHCSRRRRTRRSRDCRAPAPSRRSLPGRGTACRRRRTCVVVVVLPRRHDADRGQRLRPRTATVYSSPSINCSTSSGPS